MTVRVYGAVAEFLAREFGGLCIDNMTTVNVGIAAVFLTQFDPERVALVLINNGAADVYIRPHVPPAVGNGIRLGATGGMVAMSVRDDYIMQALDWQAISAGINNNVDVITVRRDTNKAVVTEG